MKKKLYLSVKAKFVISLLFVLCFIIICSVIQYPWWFILRDRFGPIIATLVILGLAFMPGIMVSLNIIGIILDKPRRRPIVEEDLEDVTVLIAAYNEEEGIYDTLKSLAAQDYCNKTIHVKVIDNNSKDNTKNEVFKAQRDFPNIDIQYLFESKQGKFAALNKGLSTTDTRYVITIDADTFIYKDAIKIIVNAITQESKNKPIGAMAGTILVRNSRVNLLTKIQEWEYFLSITAAKRVQGLFQSILVAQGAFSIYDTKITKELGGWKNSIGEDIVITWEMFNLGYRTYYEDCAIAFTNVPTDFEIFKRQRSRWARGMVEGYRHFSFKKCKLKYAKFMILLDSFLFMIDTMVTLAYIPGLIAGIFLHDFILVGPATFIMVPITFLLFGTMLISERNRVFKTLGLKIRKNYLGFIAFALSSTIIMSPMCLKGYIQEMVGTKRKWK